MPKEVQWEYAARGGIDKTSHRYKYAGSNQLKEVAWYNKNSHRESKSVGLKLPNSLGIFDMNGNVWEWCEDAWHDNYNDFSKNLGDWRSEGDTLGRVFRGGSWSDDDSGCRISFRLGVGANFIYDDAGFRVVRC